MFKGILLTFRLVVSRTCFAEDQWGDESTAAIRPDVESPPGAEPVVSGAAPIGVHAVVSSSIDEEGAVRSSTRISQGNTRCRLLELRT